MKLYYSPGACSLAPHIALREAERTFDLVRVDLRSHRTATDVDYYTINPKGYVPALQIDGLVLTEVGVVLQYISDLVPERGLAPPAGTIARYHLQEWLSFISGEIHKQFGPLFSPETPAPTAERLRGKISERFHYLQKVLTDRAYLMGETFGVADAYLFVMLRWCERFGIDLHLWENLDNFHQRVSARPSVQAALLAEGLVETHRRYKRSA